jgi:hypothetical protein
MLITLGSPVSFIDGIVDVQIVHLNHGILLGTPDFVVLKILGAKRSRNTDEICSEHNVLGR